MNYRHEWKHEISYGDVLVLRRRLSVIMKRDEHAVDGRYFVRSLYFDNASDKALREKLDGVNIREKFRIRCYNNDISFVCLEKKSKINGLCSKESVSLSTQQAQAIANGDYSWIADSEVPLIQELYSKMISQGLRPKTIVDYEREPFVFHPGNVRVTLDYNIRTGMNCTDFLNPDCVTVPIVNAPIILEVKWDEYLPDIIRAAVQLPNCRTEAIALALAFGLGMFIFLVYKKTYQGVMYSSSFGTTLVALTMITTMVILAVTSNVVLSLGMVGALSIVRFRTAIKEPLDIAFLFWSIAVGIVLAAGMIPLAVAGSVIIGIILLVFVNKKSHCNPYIVVLSCTDSITEKKAVDFLNDNVKKCVVKSKTAANGSVELNLEIRMASDNTDFINNLSTMPGVNSAALVSYNGEYMG